MVRNDFDQPIIAQWLRINPTRWADRISMRVELYGCEYIPDTLSFNGKSMIKLDLSRNPVASLRDTVRLRFKTNHESGVLLYSKGSQGDYIALQLVENRYIYLLSISDARRWKTLGVPLVIGGDNLPSPVGIGLTDLPNIGGTVAPPPVPASLGLITIHKRRRQFIFWFLDNPSPIFSGHGNF